MGCSNPWAVQIHGLFKNAGERIGPAHGCLWQVWHEAFTAPSQGGCSGASWFLDGAASIDPDAHRSRPRRHQYEGAPSGPSIVPPSNPTIHRRPLPVLTTPHRKSRQYRPVSPEPPFHGANGRPLNESTACEARHPRPRIFGDASAPLIPLPFLANPQVKTTAKRPNGPHIH